MSSLSMRTLEEVRRERGVGAKDGTDDAVLERQRDRQRLLDGVRSCPPAFLSEDADDA